MSLVDLIKPHIRELSPYEPGKPMEELERELGIVKSIKLASNENPLGPSPLAVEAMRQALDEVHRYPDGASFALRTKLAARLGVKRKPAAGVNPARMRGRVICAARPTPSTIPVTCRLRRASSSISKGLLP